MCFKKLCMALVPVMALGTIANLGRCAPPAKPAIKPDVLQLLNQATDAYRKMKSYSANVTLKTVSTDGVDSRTTESSFVLALDRANRFCYRDMTNPTGTAAVSDGKRLINYKSDRNQFTETAAPADYKGINIVDDVSFEPLGTYIVALMLQGDALADKEVRESFEKASISNTVIENGKKWVVLHLVLGAQGEACDVYFADDHLIGKSTMKLQSDQVKITQTETLDNVKIDKPVDSAIFLYKPPANAVKVDRFTAPQRPGDALLTPGSGARIRLASFGRHTAPAVDPAVTALIKQASEAYSKLNSYRHTAVFRASGTVQDKPQDQSAKFSLAIERPNKLCFRQISTPAVAAVCDGKTYIDYRAGERKSPGQYTQVDAPPSIKDLHLNQDDFDPVAGSYVISLLMQDRALTDPDMLAILAKSSAHSGVPVGDSKWDTLDFPMEKLTFVLYFNPSTHLLDRTAAKVQDQVYNLILTETFQDVEIDKPVPASTFKFTPPSNSKKVPRLAL